MGPPDFDDLTTQEFDLDRHSTVDVKRACLVVISGDAATSAVLALAEGDTTVGRQPECDLCLRDDGVSRQHARFTRLADGTTSVTDLGSTNGTFVNGQRVVTRILADGDRVQLGPRTIVKYSLQDSIEEGFQQRLHALATRDPLTGVLNRRGFDEWFSVELSYARRHGRSCSLMLLDLDRFKALNDSLGHGAGDHVLKHLATVIGDALRREDHFARLGGEEFAIVARDLDESDALARADELRALVAATPAEFEGHVIPFTFSAGVATTHGNDGLGEPGAMLREADRQLYRAKTGGRNRVESTLTEAR